MVGHGPQQGARMDSRSSQKGGSLLCLAEVQVRARRDPTRSGRIESSRQGLVRLKTT